MSFLFTSDLACLFPNLVMLLDEREEAFAQHHLLLLGWHSSKLCCEVDRSSWSRRGRSCSCRSSRWGRSRCWWHIACCLLELWTTTAWLRSTLSLTALATLGALLRTTRSLASLVLTRLATALGSLHHVALWTTTLLELLATLATLLLWVATRNALSSDWLLIVHLATATRLHWVEDSWTLRWVDAGHALRTIGHAGLLHTLCHLCFELCTTLLFALSKSHVDGLGCENLAIHLGDSLGGFLWGGVADKAKALGIALVVTHDLARGDLTILLESCAEC